MDKDIWELHKGKAGNSRALNLARAKIQDIFWNIPDSRIGFFLGMESGGDVKFFSPGAPVRPHFSFSH